MTFFHAIVAVFHHRHHPAPDTVVVPDPRGLDSLQPATLELQATRDLGINAFVIKRSDSVDSNKKQTLLPEEPQRIPLGRLKWNLGKVGFTACVGCGHQSARVALEIKF